jgi:hypothetical protein
MKIFLNKILFLALGIVFIPFFANATVPETKFLSEANGSITCRPLVGGSIEKNSPVTWEVGDLGDYGDVLISWSGKGVSGSLSTVNTSYIDSGLVDDVSVTLEDESGPLTIKCDTLKVQKTLSEDVGTNNISCSPLSSSVSKNTLVTWNTEGFNSDDYGSVSITWSGTGVSGMTTQSVSNTSGYSTSGTKDDVSVTLEDKSGPLTINCNPVNVLKTLSDYSSDISCFPSVLSSTKNTTVDWGISGLENYDPSVLISWGGSVTGSGVTTSKIGGYSVAGPVSDTTLTLEDESGPLTIKCNELTIKKTLSDIDPKNISCSSNGSSFKQKASVTWGLSGINFDEFGPITTIWSGTGVSGMTTQSVSNTSGYSTSGTKDDVSVTFEDESLEGPLTIKCNSIDITTSSTGGGSSGGGSVGNTCKLIGNVDGDDACDVDILDFNILALNWGSTISGNVADLNKDGIVNILDFNILALNWTGSL